MWLVTGWASECHSNSRPGSANSNLLGAQTRLHATTVLVQPSADALLRRWTRRGCRAKRSVDQSRARLWGRVVRRNDVPVDASHTLWRKARKRSSHSDDSIVVMTEPISMG